MSNNALGGESVFLERMARKFNGKLSYFFDLNLKEPLNTEISLFGSIKLKILKCWVRTCGKRDYYNLYSHFIVNSLKLTDKNNYKIVHTAFIPMPSGKNVIPYIITTDRNFTIYYDKIIAQYKRERAYLKLILFKFSRMVYFHYYTSSLKKKKIVLTVSETARERLKKYCSVDSQVLMDTIDVNEYSCKSYDNFFINVSRITEGKGQDFIINSYKKFLAVNSNFEIYFVGGFTNSINDKKYLEKLYQLSSEIREKIHFEFNVDRSRIIDLYSRAFCGLFAGKDEDFGIVPLEMMASYKPVISLNEGGPRETIIDGRTGYLVDSEDEMSKKMVELYKNPKKCMELGKNGRNHVLRNFDDRIFISRLKEILGE